MAAPLLEIVEDVADLPRRAAVFVAERARTAVTDHGRFTFAVSGGSTPWAMFARLRDEDLPWAKVEIFQVDERVAPEGDPDRNLTHLRDSLSDAPIIHAMPVEDPDLEAAAARYAAELPTRFDLVHLGLGPDGHTASLVPGDPVLEIADRDVGLTLEYNGRRRMTLTYPVLDRAHEVLWLIAGADKTGAMRRLLAGDRSIPGAHVTAEHQVVLADRAAAG